MHRGSGATVGPAEGIVMDQTVFSLFITDPGLPQLHRPGQQRLFRNTKNMVGAGFIILSLSTMTRRGGN